MSPITTPRKQQSGGRTRWQFNRRDQGHACREAKAAALADPGRRKKKDGHGQRSNNIHDGCLELEVRLAATRKRPVRNTSTYGVLRFYRTPKQMAQVYPSHLGRCPANSYNTYLQDARSYKSKIYRPPIAMLQCYAYKCCVGRYLRVRSAFSSLTCRAIGRMTEPRASCMSAGCTLT